MNPTELVADFITRNAEILKMTLGDFTDEEMLVRPVPGANHAAWQIGHLTGSLHHMVEQVAPGVVPDSAAAYHEKFTGKTTGVDDPAYFPAKAEMIEVFSQAHAAVAQWARTLTPEDLDRPTPAKMADFAPTVGTLLLMVGGHAMMHTGQMQVTRRRLGKPLLF